MTGVRARRRAERRREILDTALETLAEEGLAGLTMPGLAKRIECAVGGLYRYFPSKEAVLFELQKEAIEALGDYQRAWIEGAACPITTIPAVRFAEIVDPRTSGELSSPTCTPNSLSWMSLSSTSPDAAPK